MSSLEEKPAGRRRGRPSATESTETRRQILRAVRRCIGQRGYDQTTNGEIAAEAGITAGSLYHYFDSKHELFLAAYDDQIDTVISCYESAIDDATGAIDKVCAIFAASVELNNEDPSLALFYAVAPIELQRHAELQTVVPRVPFKALVNDIVDGGRESGELREDISVSAMLNMIEAAALGLSQLVALTHDQLAHKDAAEAFSAIVGSGIAAR